MITYTRQIPPIEAGSRPSSPDEIARPIEQARGAQIVEEPRSPDPPSLATASECVRCWRQIKTFIAEHHDEPWQITVDASDLGHPFSELKRCRHG